MRVIWHPQAKEVRDQIANYISRQFGRKSKIRFLQEVRETTHLLKSSPDIGSIDPLFANRSKTYRSVIIHGLSKMVYYIDGDTIYIAAFWDTRREPNAQAAQVK